MPDDLADDLQSLSFGSSGRSAATTDTSTTASSSGSGPISASAPSISPAPSGCDSSCCCPKRSDPDQKPLRMTDFRFLRRLGSGDIGTVYLAQLVSVDNCPGCHKTKPNPQTAPRLLAAKVMDKEELHGRNKQGRAKAELEILKMLDHPFLPKLIASAEDNRWACLLTDFCPGGDLHVLRQRQPYKRFPEAAVRFYAAEVVVALEYLHMLGVVYRDLKPENVLVRADGHIMLTDFDLSLRCGDSASNPRLLGLSGDKAGNYDTAISCGNGIPTAPGLLTGSSQGSTVGSGGGGISASCILPSCIVPAVSCFNNGSSRRSFRSRKDKKSSKKNKKGCDALEFVAEPVGARSMSFVGTHEYLAPEIVSGEGHGSAVDWWTLGVLLFELLYGYTPFRGHDNDMTLANIVARALEFPKENNSGGGKGDKRGGRFGDDYCGPPTVSQQAKDLISGLLVKDPCRRLGSATGAAAVKRHPFFHGVNWALLRCAKPPLVPPPLPSSLFVQEAGQSNTTDGASFSSLSAGMGGMVKDNAGECCTDDEEEHDDNRRSDGCSGADSRRNSGDIGVVLVYPAAVGETSPPGSPVDFY